MPVDDDKYPVESERRRFVSGVVGSGVLAGTGITGAVTVDALTSPTGEGGGTTTFRGIENTDGPAPRAMPQIPIEIDDEGYLKGFFPEYEEVERQGRIVNVAERTYESGVTYSARWFQYCGVQSYKGLQPDASQDNYFRYSGGENYEWQDEEVSEGDKVHVSHFEDYETWGNEFGDAGVGKPASCTWRSEGLSGKETMPVQVLRSTKVEELADGSQWLEESTQDGFIAWLNKCTHFCCVPGFKQSPDAAKFGGPNQVYCPCHQSLYDPFSIVEKTFTALPRPEGD